MSYGWKETAEFKKRRREMKGSKQNEVRPIKADGNYSLYEIQILK
jgi:hypothetical protein